MRSFMWWQCCVILRRGKGKDTSSEQTVFVPGPSVCGGSNATHSQTWPYSYV